MRGTQLVPGTGLRSLEKFVIVCPCSQAYVTGLCSGQPKRVFTSVLYCTGLICNCELRRMGSTPKSTKGAIATGPAMVIRYSRLPCRLRSPPGVVSCWYGTGIFQQLLTHCPEELVTAGNRGFEGTKLPSWFRSATVCALGR